MSRLLHETTSLCAVCMSAVKARVVERGGEAWMEKSCEVHGPAEVRLSTDAAWYEATRGISQIERAPSEVRVEVERGCPFDCGPCASHTQDVRLPVITITSACNLDCPICYVHNKNDDAFHMTVEAFRSTLGHLVRAHGGELDILNLTGGEPLLHPGLLEFLEIARELGVHRVTVCSNGLKLARDEALVARLASLGARIALSFDTFEAEADLVLQGARLLDVKMRTLDILERHGVDVTLIPVVTRGVNDHEIGRIVELGLARSNVRHVEIHTMTYTGQSGRHFPRSGRVSMVEVLDLLSEQTGGLLRRDDFLPSPCAHPLCYQIAYLLLDPEGGRPVPFTRFLSRETLRACLSERLYLEPSRVLEEALQDAIAELWSRDDPGSQRVLGLLRRLIEEMFPRDRPVTREQALRAGERASKAVYVHSHMDEETFSTERIAACCDSNCYADGRTIPVCAYNVLYREREASFVLQPAPWPARREGEMLLQIPPEDGRRRLQVLP